MRPWLAASLALFALACTSGTTDTPDGGGPFCPATLPIVGTACASTGADCEYRGDGGAACVRYARCTATSGGGSGWDVTPPPSPACGAIPSGCPASFGALAQGAACPLTGGGSCTYPEGVCACASCRTDGGTGLGSVWKCLPWSAAGAGCPVPRPLLGSACATDQLTCDWNQCCSGVSLGGPAERCVGGHWQSYVTGACSCAMPACP